jgi:Uma2 family endonuclease
MFVQTKHRFSVKEYYRMAETGVLRPDARVELLGGQIFDVPRITPMRAATTHRLAGRFFKLPEEACIVSVRNPVRLDDFSEVQPDIALINYRSDYYKTRHPQPDDVFLLIEVSDSTLDCDQAEKIPAYGRAGVAEVWLVNLNELTIEVYREPHFTGYGSKTILRAGDTLAPLAFPEAAVDVAELLKR